MLGRLVSSGGEVGLLSGSRALASHSAGLSGRGAQALGLAVSVLVAHGLGTCSSHAQYLWHTGSVAPQHVGSPQIRD